MSHKRNLSHYINGEGKQKVNDTYQDEDSLVMSERGDGDTHSKFQSQSRILSMKKVPKPMIYMLKNQQ